MSKGKKKNNIIGKNKKIFLRQLNKKDSSAYCEISNDDDLKKYADFFTASNEEEAIKVIENNNSSNSRIYGIFVNNEIINDEVINNETINNGMVNNEVVNSEIVNSRMVGAIIFSTRKRMAEIDYFVGKKYRGKGYGTKAISLIAKSSRKKIDKIFFYVRETNEASNAVMSKIEALEIRRFPNLKYSDKRGALILYCLELAPKKKK